jgi:hypothetical protein
MSAKYIHVAAWISKLFTFIIEYYSIIRIHQSYLFIHMLTSCFQFLAITDEAAAAIRVQVLGKYS